MRYGGEDELFSGESERMGGVDFEVGVRHMNDLYRSSKLELNIAAQCSIATSDIGTPYLGCFRNPGLDGVVVS